MSKITYVNRSIEPAIVEDLAQKMVFISGPRQSGKTTLAKRLLGKEKGEAADKFYLNWDAANDREKIIKEQFPAGQGLLVLDEIHKYARWRQVVKGLYDKRGQELQILVTGSGRLDYYRLYPFTLPEVRNVRPHALHELMRFGGFPEPFMAASERETRRWSREYRSRIIYEELSSLENVRDVTLLEQLAIRLPDLIGSPLSLNALREDLQVSHQTVTRWMEMLENIYMIFRVYPFGPPAIRAVKKESKLYIFDWMLIAEESVRFENLVAVHLLKYAHFLQDSEGLNIELRYFRTRDGKEIDFIILQDNRPQMAVECKLRKRPPTTALKYFKRKYPNVKAIQVSFDQEGDVVTKEGIRLVGAETFLMELL